MNGLMHRSNSRPIGSSLRLAGNHGLHRIRGGGKRSERFRIFQQLPEDARFCHKCGKPQREEIAVELPPAHGPAIAAAPPLEAWLGAPSFHHPVAVRVGLFVASIATFLCLALPFGFVVWLPSAGFVSVYLFSRRTGQSLSVRNGARMGWIAGILSFLIITVLFTLIAVGLANRPGGLPGFFHEQLSTKSIPSAGVHR